MINQCKIIMYHYVRPIKGTENPEIKGLELNSFLKQIEYFKKKFNFITAKQFLNCIHKNKPIPENSILLTFDDGLKDHYQYVFPILKKLKIQGLFFPPGQSIDEEKILDVHKIQFILSKFKNTKSIIDEIKNLIKKNEEEYQLDSFASYETRFATDDRFDSNEIVLIKNLLQKILPRKLRNNFTDELFKKYVSEEQKQFAKDLYLSHNDIEEMIEEGMFFGSHGYSHEWFSFLSKDEIEIEIENSLSFLSKIKNFGSELIMSYPYGNYNEYLIKKIKDAGFIAGLTTEVGEAYLNLENSFTLKRYDTNDFPQ